ncbi:PQQ-like beta-propeller repeat protein [Verrucomicrobiales bacterium]|nr:PQQ-like beta-propeller repeat protein [Verrucomicrobiales bacterium]
MKQRRTRWKLLIILLAIPPLLRVIFSFTPYEEAGWGGAANLLTIILMLVMALVWLLLVSGLSWSRRLIGVALIGLLSVSLRFSVRHEGHMGDFFPQLAWVWTPKSDEVADSLELTTLAPNSPLTTNLPGDFPYFLGPNRDNWVSGSQLAADWAEQTPRELWRLNIGLGWSSFAVAGSFAYTLEQRGDDELTVCYEARTGNPVWVHAENVRFSESMGGDGPRSTPTVHEGKVYALGATGILLCFDGLTGEVVWRRETLNEVDQGNQMWAKSGSPLIVGGVVVITLGDSKDRPLAAFDLLTGDPRWRGGDAKPGYATPVLTTLAGKRQIVCHNTGSVSGHDPMTGEILWNHDIGRSPAHTTIPMIIDTDKVLVSVGYGHGSHLIDLSSGEPNEIWKTNKLKTKFSDMVVRNDHAYGLDEGRLVCMNIEDGQRAWRGTRFSHGQMLGVGDKLLIQAEGGEIVLAEATPEEEKIVHRFDALSSKTWNHPVLAGRLLLIRNDREAIVYEYPGNGSTDLGN